MSGYIKESESAIVPANRGAQLKTPESWGICGERLSLEEMSAAAAVTKHCGSIFSRPQSSSLLDNIETAFGISVQGLPVWLRDIQLSRTATILGAHMRRIKIPDTMKELDMFKLSGLATFVVLCCRYSEDDDTLNKMIELLILGDLGTMIKIDRDIHPNLPYTFRGHIATFVISCLDADRQSDTSNRINEWLARLLVFGNVSQNSKRLFLRREQASIDLVRQLFGAVSSEDVIALRSEDMFPRPGLDSRPANCWAKVHNTLHLTSAYIALAAALHGGRVVVECVSDGGSKMFPHEPSTEEQRSTFLVRLWLTQPPENIRGILRHSEHRNMSENGKKTDLLNKVDDEVTIVGGTLELVIWVAQKLEFRCILSDNASKEEKLLDLWKRGTEYGKKLYWATKKRLSTHNHGILLMSIKSPEKRQNIDVEALPLSKALIRTDKRLTPIARDVAQSVHNFYQFADYSNYLSEDRPLDESEFVKAMLFVVTSISIQILRNTISSASDNIDFYALNLSTLDFGTRELGNLQNLIRSALHDGVPPFNLVMTAAAVWGGAQFRATSQTGTLSPVDHMLGVVARQCTVIFDVLRDPLSFVKHGSVDRLISIWRGAVPMLPRDPRTNFIYGGSDDRWIRSEVGPDYAPKPNSMNYQANGPMLVTFEPFDTEATRGVFCFWHGGHLIAEFAPHSVLTSIMSGSIETIAEPDSYNAISTSERIPQTLVKLSKADLLVLRGFRVKGEIGVIIEELGDVAWAMFALGCASGCSVSSHHLLSFIYRGGPQAFDAEAFRVRMAQGQVVTMIPQ